MSTEKIFALRMDDVGAASKRNEVYSNWRLRVAGQPVVSGNWLFAKYLPGLRAWGRYRELDAADWDRIFRLLELREARCTVAVTACWVEDDGRLVPYPEKFPEAARRLREGARAGLVEIANHGLTHCILKDRLFRPRLLRGNREFHREFTPLLPLAEHEEHIARAQRILQDWLGDEVVTFVPPGNTFLPQTLPMAARHGLRYVSCATSPRDEAGLHIVGNRGVLAFHDREVAREGTAWVERLLDDNGPARFVTVRRLAENRSGGPGEDSRP
ncbi:polysaccharide deacetylase [Desulfovibrio sp. X2]|uniref:polysaccharide deacetylase family protein n=1 Tax=Desulfovibrio sp. X2 TaxID=941449 RepID=UPI000358F4CA|nr:polysaccharide deacetylase family protein [Desulfovibrio sp. X2]EPR37169.1 polysaccharide deacetylase [Desulfovibrio sp. X2]